MNDVEIDYTDVNLGDDVTVWGRSERGYLDWGQGGKVQALIHDAVHEGRPVKQGLMLSGPNGERHLFFLSDSERFPHGSGITREEPLPATDCLNYSHECRGKVDHRMPLSGTGKSFPRCDYHWDMRLAEQARINERYPAQPPSDWSPLDAGEAWEED